MNPCEQTASITAAADAIACRLDDDEMTLLAAVPAQLGDTPRSAYPLGWPVADSIEEVAKTLLCYFGFSQKGRAGIVHIGEENTFHGAYPQRVVQKNDQARTHFSCI